jgi:CHAT domain-containing protein
MRRLLGILIGSFGLTAQDLAPEIQRVIDECRIQWNQQHYDAAIQLAQQGVDLSRSTSDKRGMAYAFYEMGRAYYNKQSLENAFQASKQAEALAAEVGDSDLQGRATTFMGSELRDQGKLDEALGYYARARTVFTVSGDVAGQARVLNMIGLVYRYTGDLDRAVSMAQEGLALARQAKDPSTEVNSLHELGVYESQRSHFDLALQYLNDALKIPVANTLMRGQILSALSTASCSLKQYNRCIDYAQEEIGLAEASGNAHETAYGYLKISEAQELLGAHADAYQAAVKALTALRSSDFSPYDEWHFLASIGQELHHLGRDAEAAEQLQEAIKIVERLRQTLVPTEKARAASAAGTKELFDVTTEVLFDVNRSKALQTVELSRARAFLAILAESKIDLRDGLSPADRDRETALMVRAAGIQKTMWQRNVNDADRKKRTAELEAAESDLENLRMTIRRANPRLAAVQYPQPLGLEQIQREVLKPGTTLLEYSLGEKRSFVWAISKDRSSAAVLPSGEKIEATIKSYREALTRNVSALTLHQADADAIRLSSGLYDMLVKPVEASLEGTKSLIVVPDGGLYYLAFESLSGGSPGRRYLLERFPISYAPSATSLMELTQPSPAAPAKTLLAFGDPVYSVSSKGPGSGTRGPDLGQLPYTREEVTGIASLFPKEQSALYLGASAREESVKSEALDGYRFIHFATHGILDESHPSRSALALSVSSTAEDGLLQVSEIANLRIRAELVTLSACSTGLGELVSGEGMLGLVRAFLYAGASSVAVSLWNVNDAATSALMKEFYRGLSHSVSPEEALRRAQLSLIHQADSPWHHPHYWAPFVLWLR